MEKELKIKVKALGGRMSIPDLILLAILSLTDGEKECSFEKLLQECYFLSPRTFCFARKQEWPDARKIDRPLRTLRKRGLIKISPDSRFSLTHSGRKAAEETAKTLRQEKLFKD